MKSIRFKLWAGMMALVLIVLILLWLFQIVFLESFYTNIRISDVKNQVASVIKTINYDNTIEYENELDNLAYNNNMSIEIINLQRISTYTSSSSGSGSQMPMINSSREEVYQEALSGNEVSITLIHQRFGNKFIMLGLPIQIEGKIYAVMIVNLPLAPVEDTSSILKSQLLYITIILLAASLFLSFLISRGFTKPILDITNASEKMSMGDFNVRIRTKKQDEIGKLAQAINNLGAQLSKIEQLRKDLIANVSHELKTPLSLIRGYAETIRDVSGDMPEKREKQLQIIIEETERLNKIVEDILNLSQLQSGYISLNIDRFIMNKTLETVKKRYELLSEETGIDLIVEKISDIYLEGDEARIEQVLFNLINNAYNHTPSGGTIAIKALDLNDRVRIEISNSGKRIPKEDISHIWDRYYKADKTSRKKSVGTGLGLAIVKEILEAHKSGFGVESDDESGTTFWFDLKKC
jgi:signal transduction histidine kinase